MSLPSVYIVVLNWNGLALTRECLRSLGRVTYPATHVVVVDNGSTDGSPEALAMAFPGVTLLRNERNLGFAGGNNVGIAYAREHGADYVLLLNNDTVVAEGFLEPLLAVAESDSQVGMVCPVIYFQTLPGEIWAAGVDINLRRWRRLIPRGNRRNVSTMLFALRGHHERDDGRFAEVQPVDGATGCACMIKRQALAEVGLLDESFYLIHEDSDWSTRLGRAGYRIMLVPQSLVWHRVGASGRGSSPLKVYYATRNALLFVSKHAGWPVRLWIYLLGLAALFRHGLGWLLGMGDRELSRAQVRATLDFARGRLGERQG